MVATLKKKSFQKKQMKTPVQVDHGYAEFEALWNVTFWRDVPVYKHVLREFNMYTLQYMANPV